MSKAPIHYTQGTLESETPTAICGIRTSHAASTENAQAVTCQRCLKALNKSLPFVEPASDGPQTNDMKEESMSAGEGSVLGMPIDSIENVQESPSDAIERTEAVLPVVEQEMYKIVSDGVELGEALALTDATKQAQEASETLGSEVVVTVTLGGIIKAQYCEGRHTGPSKLPSKASAKTVKPKSESRESLAKAVKKTMGVAPKSNGKVTNIKDAKPQPTKTAKQPAPVRLPKPAVAKELPLCKCGCGERTKGGIFRPGHDARYYSAQAKAGKGGHTAAKAAKK